MGSTIKVMTLVKIWCRVCGESFKGRLDSQFCSVKCRRAARQQMGRPVLPGQGRVDQLHDQLMEAQDGVNTARLKLAEGFKVMVDVTNRVRDMVGDGGDDEGED